MARKTPSRHELRKQVEAAEARGAGDGATKKKKVASSKAKSATVRRKRKKEKVQPRRRLVWVVYNAGMKEEARFPYDQRDEADKKADALRKKAGKLYFVQPVKENISDGPAEAPEENPTRSKKTPVEVPEVAADVDDIDLDVDEEFEEEEELDEDDEEEPDDEDE